MTLITIDPYYDNTFFNECKEALKNNNVKFKQFISIKPPYNWYFKLDSEPTMLNYDTASKDLVRWMVNVIEPLRPNEEYLLVRRNSDNGAKSLLKFVENEPLRISRKSDYSVFFNVRNREEIEKLSGLFAGKIWFMGKYFNGRYRVCLCNHSAIKGFLRDDQILLEKNKQISEPGRFEAELNWALFKGNDYLLKFSETPYFLDGYYARPKIKGDQSSKFII